MSLASRLGNLVSAIGADIKSLSNRVSTIENGSFVWDGGATPDAANGGTTIARSTSRLRGQGSRMYVYGDSGATIPGYKCTVGKEWMNLVAARIGADGRPISYAVGGSDAIGVCFHVLNGSTSSTGLPSALGGSKWDTTRRGLVFVHTGVNDSGIGTGDRIGGTTIATTPDHQSGMVGALRTIFAVISSASRIESSVLGAVTTLTGTWADSSTPLWSGSNAKFTQTAGDKIDFNNVVVPATGRVHVILASLAPESWVAPTVEIRVDGVLVKTVPQQTLRMRKQTVTASYNIMYAPCAIEVAATPGTHTITLTNVANPDGSVGLMLVDCLLIPSTTPPPIFFPKEWKPIAYGNDIDLLWANYETLFALYHGVCDEFPNVKVVQYSMDPTKSKVLGNDNLHPNDRGMVLIADDYTPAIQDHLANYDPDNMYLSLDIVVTELSAYQSGGPWPATSGTNVVMNNDAVVFINGGTVTDIQIDDQTTGMIAGAFPLGKGHRIKAVFTVAPTYQTFDLSMLGRT